MLYGLHLVFFKKKLVKQEYVWICLVAECCIVLLHKCKCMRPYLAHFAARMLHRQGCGAESRLRSRVTIGSHANALTWAFAHAVLVGLGV